MAFLAAAFSEARRALRGASACVTAHCGWIPAGEYDGCPHTGQLAGLAPLKVGTGFFSLIRFTLSSLQLFTGRGPAHFSAAKHCLSWRRSRRKMCLTPSFAEEITSTL